MWDEPGSAERVFHDRGRTFLPLGVSIRRRRLPRRPFRLEPRGSDCVRAASSNQTPRRSLRGSSTLEEGIRYAKSDELPCYSWRTHEGKEVDLVVHEAAGWLHERSHAAARMG